MFPDRRTSQDCRVARLLCDNQGKILPGRGNSEYTVPEDRTIGPQCDSEGSACGNEKMQLLFTETRMASKLHSL